MEFIVYIVVIGFAVLASAFFAGYETGLISLNRMRLHHEAQRNDRRAQILEAFINNPDRLLGITLTGANISHVMISVFATALFVKWMGEGFGVEFAAELFISAIVLVLGEIVPKTLFRRYPHRLCITLADVLSAAAWFLAPIVLVLSMLMRFVARVSRPDGRRRTFSVTREELKHLAREGEVDGELTADEREMILGVFDFPFKTIFEVMIPLGRTVTVGRDTTVADLLAISDRTGYARFPVRDGAEIPGIVNVYEILFDPAATGDKTIAQYMRKPPVVVATERVNRLLPRLRASRTPLSVVINPEGQSIGIVSIEDIVEEIVGEVEG